MISDFHTHTVFSGDCTVPVREQIAKAINLGMEEVCITDHNDYCVNSGDIDFNLDFDSYIGTLQRIKTEYQKKIRVNIGVEMGLQPHISKYCREIALRYPFDFIIGSIHFINVNDPYYPEYFQGRTSKAAYLEYFDTVLSCIKACDDFDVLGHLDYILRYGPKEDSSVLQYLLHGPVPEAFASYIEEILSVLISRGKGLECNTCGFRCGLGQPNPSPWILKKYREMGGEIITIGSDAHESSCLGSCFKEASELLKGCGFDFYTVFHERKPVFLKL